MRTSVLLCFLIALAPVGCGDDDAPPAIPPLAELELLAPGSTSGDAPCVSRGDDLRQSITVEVVVENFALRPPLSCSVRECGTVQLSLKQGDDEWTFTTAQEQTSIPTRDLPDGEVKLEAQLLDTFGQPYQSRDELPARCQNCNRTFLLQTAACDGEADDDVPSDDDDVEGDGGTMGEVDGGSGGDAGSSDAGSDSGVLTDAGFTANDDAGEAPLDDGGTTAADAATGDAGAPVSVDAAAAPDSGSEPEQDASADAGVLADDDAG